MAGCVVLLGACTTNVPVQADFPTPLMQPLPARVGIYLGDELKNYEYHEEIPQNSKWAISLGDANVEFFQPLFKQMFQQTEFLDQFPPPPEVQSRLDGIIEPRIEKFEFDVPRDSKSEFMEVWIQYRMNLYRPDGTLITDWPVSGYGKSRKGTFRSSKSMANAAVRAMRSVGATMVVDFPHEPAVSDWLQEVHYDARAAANESPTK